MYVFVESIGLLRDGAPLLPYHQKRFSSTQIEAWGRIIHPPLKEILPQCHGNGLHKARLLYGQKNYEWDVQPYHRRKLLSLRVVQVDYADYHLKYLDKSLFENLKKGCGSGEDILIALKGEISDTSFSNVAFFDGRKWLTPARPLLKGTRRAELLDKKIIFERNILLKDIRSFSKIALFNALLDWDSRIELPVNKITIPDL